VILLIMSILISKLSFFYDLRPFVYILNQILAQHAGRLSMGQLVKCDEIQC